MIFKITSSKGTDDGGDPVYLPQSFVHLFSFEGPHSSLHAMFLCSLVRFYLPLLSHFFGLLFLPKFLSSFVLLPLDCGLKKEWFALQKFDLKEHQSRSMTN